MRAQLAGRRVVGGHLRREARRDANGLVGHQQVEVLRGQHDPVADLGLHDLPELLGVRLADAGQVQERSRTPRPVADATDGVRAQIESEEQPVRERQPIDRHRSTVREQDRVESVEGTQVAVGQLGAADGEAELVEREVLLHPHRERQGDDFEVEPAGVTVGDLVEAVGPVGDDAREHVGPAGGALRVRLAADSCREVQRLLERDEVRASRFQHDTVVAEVEFVDDQVLHPGLDRLAVGKEAAADPVRHLAQAEIQAGGLDVRRRDLEPPGVDDPLRDRGPEVFVGQDALAGRKLEHGHLGRRRSDPRCYPAARSRGQAPRTPSSSRVGRPSSGCAQPG